jgi:hypothetical protein
MASPSGLNLKYTYEQVGQLRGDSTVGPILKQAETRKWSSKRGIE